MATRNVCSSTSTSTSTSKLYSSTSTSAKYASEAIAISTTNSRRLDCIIKDMYKIFAVSDNENLWLLRHILGIPSVQTMIENRRRKFIGNLLNDEIFTVVLYDI